jgi:hypothetical protein
VLGRMLQDNHALTRVSIGNSAWGDEVGARCERRQDTCARLAAQRQRQRQSHSRPWSAHASMLDHIPCTHVNHDAGAGSAGGRPAVQHVPASVGPGAQGVCATERVCNSAVGPATSPTSPWVHPGPNPTLHHTTHTNTHPQGLSSAGAGSILAVLRSHPALHALLLSCNEGFGDAGLAALCDGGANVPWRAPLTHLELAGCGLTAEV